MDEDNKKEKNRFSAFENFSFRKVFRYNLLILIIFLLFAGISSFFLLSDQASKLIGGPKYSELTSNSSHGKFSLIEKIKYFFSGSKDETMEAKNKSGLKDLEGPGLEDSSSGAGGSSSSANSENSGKGGKSNSKGGVSFHQGGQKSVAQSLSADLSSPQSFASGSKSQTSLSQFQTGSKANIGINTGNQKVMVAKPNGKNSASAMELLKSAYKAALLGARDASNDTARSWTSKAFDSSPDVKNTLKYDEQMRTKLDKINPKSIPDFLKDETMDPKYNSLKTANVPDPIAKKDENASENSKDNIEKMMQDMASGVIPKAASQDGDSREPKSPADEYAETNGLAPLYSHSDDYGNYTVYKDKNGYIYLRVTNDTSGPNGTGLPDNSFQVYDPTTNKIAFCSVPGQGMLMPGEGGCAPPDMTWQWDEGYEQFANYTPS